MKEQLENKEKLYKSVNLSKYENWTKGEMKKKQHELIFSHKNLREKRPSGVYSEYVQKESSTGDENNYEGSIDEAKFGSIKSQLLSRLVSKSHISKNSQVSKKFVIKSS